MKRRVNEALPNPIIEHVIFPETLPLPFVVYPTGYGAFFAFQETEASEPCFCSCARRAIQNYIALRLRSDGQRYSPRHYGFLLDAHRFPFKVVDRLIANKVSENEGIIEQLQFRDKLCHECNKTKPRLKYCIPMYGGRFMQSHGWYVNKCYYEFGLDPLLLPGHVLEDCCPKEILNLLSETIPGEEVPYRDLVQRDFKEANRIHNLVLKRNRQIARIVESEVRVRFGWKKVGEQWDMETKLFYVIKAIFKDAIVHHHYRPDFLEGLELDIFLPGLKLAIEYHGIQHFEVVEHWGGEEGLADLRIRDARKAALCLKNNIKLVCFSYDDRWTWCT